MGEDNPFGNLDSLLLIDEKLDELQGEIDRGARAS